MARLADPALAVRRRQQILDAAELCFRRRGFHQATMQEICAEARISPGALYRYFDSKADIIAAIAEDKHRTAELATERAAGEGGLVEALTGLCGNFLTDFARCEFAPLYADIVGEAARDPLLRRRLAEIDAHSRACLARGIAAGQARGEVDPALDPSDAAQLVMAAIEGVCMRAAMTQFDGGEDSLRVFRAFIARYLAPAP